MPSFFSCSTVLLRLLRRISGYVCGCRSFSKDDCVYSRKHLPATIADNQDGRFRAQAIPITMNADSAVTSKHAQILWQSTMHMCTDSPVQLAAQSSAPSHDNHRAAIDSAPGRVRPARPLRWCAEAREMGDTSSDSTRCRGLYTFCFEKPGSMTYTMPSIVSEVSAMLVDTTTLRPGGPSGRRGAGASSKMRCCCRGGREE